MTRTHRHLVRTATLCVSLLPALALAHAGHGAEDSFLAGVLHPANGIDHVAGFFLVGLLASRLEARIFRPMIAALLGLLVAAWTADSDGWQYAAGFMLTGAVLAAAGVGRDQAHVSVDYCSRTTLTDLGGRRSTSASPFREALIFTGAIASGTSGVLRASMVFEVSTRPTAPPAFAPFTRGRDHRFAIRIEVHQRQLQLALPYHAPRIRSPRHRCRCRACTRAC